MKKGKKNIFGFTLVELLIVIAIIGLLTGMIVISTRHIKAKARDGQRVSDINSISTALTLYHNDYNAYPVFDGYITGDDILSISLEDAGAIKSVPVDPLNVDDYRYYYQGLDGTDYYLQYYLETNSILGKEQGLNYFVP